MPPAAPDWTPCLDTLQALLQLINATQTEALQSLNSGQADGYAARCGELAQALANCQPGLAQALAQATPPTQVMELMQQVKSSLDLLRESTTRLQASNARALNVLFPSDQVQAYSRLGSKAYGAAKPGSAYLKA